MIPSANCKGLCQACCGPLLVTGLERELVEEVGGSFPDPIEVFRQMAEANQSMLQGKSLGNDAYSDCPNLTDEGQCSVYEVRPTVCRLWGVTENMPCLYGCEPERMLTEKYARGLVDRAKAVGGPDASRQATITSVNVEVE